MSDESVYTIGWDDTLRTASVATSQYVECYVECYGACYGALRRYCVTALGCYGVLLNRCYLNASCERVPLGIILI